MPEKTNDETLAAIKDTLDDIKSILLLVNQEKIAVTKKILLKEGSIEKQVYDLCDGENTIQDISDVIKKSKEYTGAVISTLRQKGLIKTLQKDGKKIQQQIL